MKRQYRRHLTNDLERNNQKDERYIIEYYGTADDEHKTVFKSITVFFLIIVLIIPVIFNLDPIKWGVSGVKLVQTNLITKIHKTPIEKDMRIVKIPNLDKKSFMTLKRYNVINLADHLKELRKVKNINSNKLPELRSLYLNNIPVEFLSEISDPRYFYEFPSQNNFILSTW